MGDKASWGSYKDALTVGLLIKATDNFLDYKVFTSV
jgi:hypothetical protein